jgi:hypothetical protein
MQSSDNKNVFLALVRLGIGHHDDALPNNPDWEAIKTLAAEQGLSAVVVDGIEKMPDEQRPPKMVLLQWIGETLQQEQQYGTQQKAAEDMASLFHHNYIRTYVLKGTVVAECYPKPSHRMSADMDCYLLPEKGEFDAWSLGNDLMKASGYEVGIGFYKNSSFHLPDVLVENHQYLTPFRGNRKLKELERLLQAWIHQDTEPKRFDGTWLNRPPVMVSALFLIEHAYSHFLHEGLTWRMVLDWVMFRKKHEDEIDWKEFKARIDEFGFFKFYDAFVRMGLLLMGELSEEELTISEKSMLDDIWSPLDLPETLHGVKGKLALVGSTLRARWKYRYFGDISMTHGLWIQVIGFLFMKHPKLQ